MRSSRLTRTTRRTAMPVSDALEHVARSMLRHDSLVITCHVDPDPDCLGSMLALAWGLRRLGKTVAMVSPDPVPEQARFLPGSEDIVVPPAPEAEALVIVDCEPARTGAVRAQLPQFSYVYNIDHHVSNSGESTVHCIDPRAAATGELIFRLLTEHWRLTLEQEPAVNLYAALMSDTGSFRYGNTTATTLSIAARLVEAGAKPDAIAAAVYEQMPWRALQLLKLALNALGRSDDGRIAWVIVTRDMLAQAGAVDDDVAGLVQYPRAVAGVEVALLLRELADGQTRISLRSRGRVDVSVVAGAFGGGGHPGAAGCTINASVSEALQRIVAEVSKWLPPLGPSVVAASPAAGPEGAETP